MFPPDLQAEFLDLEMLQQMDICPEEVEAFNKEKAEKEEQEEDVSTPLPF